MEGATRRTIEGGDLKSDRRICGQIHFCDVSFPYGMKFDSGEEREKESPSAPNCVQNFLWRLTPALELVMANAPLQEQKKTATPLQQLLSVAMGWRVERSC